MTFRRTVLHLALILVLSQAALAAQIYTPHSRHQRLGMIDTATGAFTDLGSFKLPEFGVIPALAIDAEGTLYGLFNFRGTPNVLSQLISIDPETAEVSPVGFPNTFNLTAFEIGPDGTMYAGGFHHPELGWSGDSNLYRVDKATGQLTSVGDTGLDTLMDLAFDSAGTMWGTVGNELYVIDTHTGAADHAVTITGLDAAMADPNAEVMGIMFDENDVLYATTVSLVEKSPLLTIDTLTGEATIAAMPELDIPHGGDTYLGPDSLASAREQQLKAIGLSWDEAFNAGDLDRLMEHYAEEAISMPPGRPSMDKAMLREDLRWLFDNYTAHHVWKAVAFQISGDLAVERGEYTMTYEPKAGNEPLPDEIGKHVMVFRRIEDEWRIVWEIWSTDG
jgi:ketosteroid isomerase-like protein